MANAFNAQLEALLATGVDPYTINWAELATEIDPAHKWEVGHDGWIEITFTDGTSVTLNASDEA